MATDIQIIKYRDAGRAQTYGCSDPNTAVAQQNTYFVTFAKASDDAMASTTTSETYTGKGVEHKARLRALYYRATTGGITADASNNATVTISVRDSAGTTLTTVATLTTNVALGNVTQGARVSCTLTDANVVIAAGSTVTYSIAKGGTGVVFRAGEFSLELERV